MGSRSRCDWWCCRSCLQLSAMQAKAQLRRWMPLVIRCTLIVPLPHPNCRHVSFQFAKQHTNDLRKFCNDNGLPHESGDRDILLALVIENFKQRPARNSSDPACGSDCLPIDFKTPATDFRWTKIDDEVSATTILSLCLRASLTLLYVGTPRLPAVSSVRLTTNARSLSSSQL